MDEPYGRTVRTLALDPHAQRAHRLGGVEHVLALEQAADPGLADRERAQDQGAV